MRTILNGIYVFIACEIHFEHEFSLISYRFICFTVFECLKYIETIFIYYKLKY